MFVRRSQSLRSASSLKVCIAYVERKGFPLSLTFNRWFSRYVIAAMLVDGKQKLAYQLVLFVHQHLFISPLLFVSPETAWRLPIGVIFVYPLSHYTQIQRNSTASVIAHYVCSQNAMFFHLCTISELIYHNRAITTLLTNRIQVQMTEGNEWIRIFWKSASNYVRTLSKKGS